MSNIRITRRAKGIGETLAQDDYRKKHPRAKMEDLAGIYGANLDEAEEIEIRVPAGVREELKREVVGVIRKARLAYLIDEAWGDIELAKTGGDWWMWLEYEGASGEKTMIQGAYDMDADTMRVYRAEAA